MKRKDRPLLSVVVVIVLLLLVGTLGNAASKSAIDEPVANSIESTNESFGPAPAVNIDIDATQTLVAFGTAARIAGTHQTVTTTIAITATNLGRRLETSSPPPAKTTAVYRLNV